MLSVSFGERDGVGETIAMFVYYYSQSNAFPFGKRNNNDFVISFITTFIY